MRPAWLRTTFTLLLISSGCPGGRPLTTADLERVQFDELARFESQGAFDDWYDDVERVRSDVYGSGSFLFGCAQADIESAAQAPAAEDSITNNQVLGVDEGDIVKAVGEYFVVLRRGRLFTIRQSEAGQEDLRAVSSINAYPPGFSQGTWYDEILVHEDRIVMIGYSYQVQATEVGQFRIDEAGQLSHLGTHFVSSNDYYSSRNYASRLVDGKLVLYMPYGLFGYGSSTRLPTVQTWQHGDDLSAPEQILDPTNIYRPIQGAISPAVHTVLTCDLEGQRFDCDASGVVGPFGRTFHVSRDAVYVWVSDGGYDYYYSGNEPLPSERRERAEGRAVVYRLPLNGDAPSALRTFGQPIDQFSFLESEDGHLNVLVSDSGAGDWMWSAEVNNVQRLALMRVPLSAFDNDGASVSPQYYRELTAPEEYGVQNRFVGQHLLWGAGSAWYGSSDPRVFATRFADSDAPIHDIELSHGVERIEVMGSAAVVVGASQDSLGFSAIELGAQTPLIADTYHRAGAVQGETRSHGFFFKADAAGGGTLGLPVRLQGGAWAHLWQGSAEVLFLSVDESHHFEPVGALRAHGESARDDACAYSCVDWYGNARPIFYRGRIFALMGYELVEGRLDGDMREIRRLDFTPPG